MLTLWVIDKDGMPLRKIKARVGLKTYSGPIIKVSDKSIWTQSKDGNVKLHRAYDGRLPSIYQSYAPKAK